MAMCPRCRQDLAENQVDEFSVAVCQPCQGVFVRHTDLVSILDRSWRSIPADTAEKAEFVAPENWQHEPALRCPQCVAPMEKYGYMGLVAIQLDRCDRCEAVWLDATELENMVVALARSNYRSEKSLRREWESSRDIASVGMAGMASKGLREGQWDAVRVLLRLLR